MADHIHYDADDGIASIHIDRSDKRNAFNVAMFGELTAAFGRAEADDAVRATLVTAEGPDFTTGLDLTDVAPAWMRGERPLTPDDVDPWAVLGRRRTKPMICAVQGRCYTLGFELALASEACVATRDAVFALREVRAGIFPAGGGVERLVLGAGWSTAMRYVLTGDDLPATEAHRLGLVPELAPDADAARDRAQEIADAMASAAPLAVRGALAHARRAVEAQWGDAQRAVPDAIQGLINTADAREAAIAAVQRRDPRFRGE